MACGSSLRGVSAARGFRRHDGALAVVAVASAAAHGDDVGVGACGFADGVEHVGECVGRVGVVDYGCDACAVHGLEASGHGAQGAEGAQGLVSLSAEQARGAVDGEQVGGVEASGERRVEFFAVDVQEHAVDAVFHYIGAEVGLAPQAVGVHARTRVLHQYARVRVVGVDERPCACGQCVEEHFFGFEIGLEGAVVVEMVAGEVGEHASGETQACYASLRAGVAAHFHCGECAAFGHHFGQERVEFERVGGGVGGGYGAVGDAVHHCAEQSCPQACAARHVVEECCYGGFAVGAGDAYEREAARGVAVPC